MRDSKRLYLALAATLSMTVASAQEAQERGRYANRPDSLVPYSRTAIYKEVYADGVEFKGAGRDLPEPEVKAIKIGFIGPLTEEDGPLVPPGFRPAVEDGVKSLFGRHLLRGAELAMEEANSDGGYRGLAFELVKRTDLVQWGQSSDELVKFAYEDHVWAVLSGIDSNHAHVLNRVTLKVEVPLLNAGSTDPTLTEHKIPWLARCMNDDRLNSYEILNYIHRVKGFTRIALLRVNDRDGRVGVGEFIKGARRLGTPVLLELRFRNGDREFNDQLQQIRALDPEVVVLWANPDEAALIMKQARAMGMKQLFVGFDRLAHPYFLNKAGSAAEGMVVVSTMNPDARNPVWVDFQEQYRRKFGEEPDAYAAHGYDGMRLIVDAVRRAGLNRARIRDALASIAEFPGASGRIRFDATLNDVGRPWLATVQAGRFEYSQPDDWPRTERFPMVLKALQDPVPGGP